MGDFDAVTAVPADHIPLARIQPANPVVGSAFGHIHAIGNVHQRGGPRLLKTNVIIVDDVGIGRFQVQAILIIPGDDVTRGRRCSADQIAMRA